MAQVGEVICGLDIGTTKVAAIIGEVTQNGVEILGVGTSPSDGLRQGVVVNIEATTASIQAAIEEAEQMAAADVQSVFVGIAGGHIRGFSSNGQVSMRSREVEDGDVARVIEQAKAVNIPLDRQIIHTVPLEYIIDGQGQIRDPIGMNGVRMEVRAHVITAAVTSVQNIVKCCNRASLDVVEVVVEPLASAMAVLHEDERDLGVVMIDIGGGTTDIAVYYEGSNVFTSVIVLGGHRITQDVAHGLRTSVPEAEAIKRKHGCSLISMVQDDEEIEVPGVGPRPPRSFKRRFLAEVIEPRVEEIFLMAQQELLASGCADLAASGLVLTGGAAMMDGMLEIAEDIFQMPVRRGVPTATGGSRARPDARLAEGGFAGVIADPKYATGVGLVLFGATHEPMRAVETPRRVRDEGPGIARRFGAWVREMF
ncbi:MAG: cell division protein FtsA [Deltaproteobacteria bacterium]|nr:cell division protein FtsA [Deltaproteobacteria bacterium]MBK8719700.1 cell division protein FtsA [Deltaproteobacteria bacterium]MBP7288686.1 cell division protein FtsA [Nannocystaceae bacterium]